MKKVMVVEVIQRRYCFEAEDGADKHEFLKDFKAHVHSGVVGSYEIFEGREVFFETEFFEEKTSWADTNKEQECKELQERMK